MSVEPPEEPPRPPSEGRLRPMSPSALTAWGVVGLVAGWLFHRVLYEGPKFAPLVPWSQSVALILVAGILAVTARVDPAQRPAAARAGSLRTSSSTAWRSPGPVPTSAALAAGAYFGYALSWIRVDSDLATERMIRSAVAGVCGLLVVAAGLLLERACRVPPDDDEP